jgi:hypothetical protein
MYQQLGDIATGYPNWGRTHTVVLEPWTSFPGTGLNDVVANHTALTLPPGGQVETRYCAVAYTGLARVSGISADGAVNGTPG